MTDQQNPRIERFGGDFSEWQKVGLAAEADQRLQPYLDAGLSLEEAQQLVAMIDAQRNG